MPQRLALLIANSEYEDVQLKRLRTPTADAERLAQVLRDPAIGDFEVDLLVNESFLTVRRAVARLYQRKTRDDLLLLYYSGHGIKPDYGELFLAVRDTDRDIPAATALEATFVRDQMDRSHSQRKVVFLDCCHSGAFGEGVKGLGENTGTDQLLAGNGYGRVIITASNALEYAWEGDKLVGEAGLSVFTRFLVQGLKTGAADRDGDGEVALDELYDYVHSRVINEGTARQTPQKWEHKVEGRLFIARNPQGPLLKTILSPELEEDIRSDITWRRLGAVSELARFLESQNTGLVKAAQTALRGLQDDDSRQVSAAATKALDRLAPATTPESQPDSKPVLSPKPPPAAPRVVASPKVLRITAPIEMELLRVPGGEFTMGSDPARDRQAQDDEKPLHLVDVSEFYISKYPVTHKQYVVFVRASGYKSQGTWTLLRPGKDDHPVTNVSWQDAVAFCKWLSEQSGLAARLPTEAEWEKAARGTDGRIYPWGDAWDPKNANVKGSGSGGTTPVGQYSPGGDSPYGAADMAGNVWEWCADWWEEGLYATLAKYVAKDPVGPTSGQYRVFRGGSWYDEPLHARCGVRFLGDPYDSVDSGGFRVACAPPSSAL